MGDFEERLGRALTHGAEQAPDAAGLAAAARGRAKLRRRRAVVAGAAAAVVTAVIPAAVVVGIGPNGEGPPPAADPDAVRVTCGGDIWPVAAMTGSLRATVDERDVRAAFADRLETGGDEGMTALEAHGAADTPYVVLIADDDEVTIGVGEWTADGPGPDGDILSFRRTDGGLEFTSADHCRTLWVAPPEGRVPVEVTAPEGGVDRSSSTLTVMVTEYQCSGGRDPRPFLGEPQVVESDDRVTIAFSAARSSGAHTCLGNVPQPVTVELSAPLGERALYDGGTWPATLVER